MRCGDSSKITGAEGGIRTPTPLRAPAPQAGASASSATSARGMRFNSPIRQFTSFYLGRSGVDGAGVVGAGVVGAGVVWAGAVAGFVGADGAGVGVSGAFTGEPGTLDGGGGAAPLTIEPGPRCPMIASASAPTMKMTARTVVAFDSTVAPARAPNADWLLPPPNAAAMSPLPCCSRITRSSSRQTITYRVESR